MRAFLLAGAALVLLACAPVGTTCGRGRCPDDSQCVSAVGRSDPVEYAGTSLTESQNRIDNEWWCVRPCPSDVTCAGGLPSPQGSGTACLMDPSDHQRNVCATNAAVSVAYHSRDRTAAFVSSSTCSEFTVASYSIGNSTTRCQPDQLCSAGQFGPGSSVPGNVVVRRPDGTDVTVAINGIGTMSQPPQMAQYLPKGEQLIVYTSFSSCPD